MRSSVKGSDVKRTPVASRKALPMAGGTGLFVFSATDFEPKRPDLIVRVGAEDFRLRGVGDRRYSIVAQRRIDHGAALVVDHLLLQSVADAHHDAADDLAAQLVRIDHDAGIDGFHAIENHDLPGDAMDR